MRGRWCPCAFGGFPIGDMNLINTNQFSPIGGDESTSVPSSGLEAMFPRVSGDEPWVRVFPSRNEWFSPREWG